MLVQKKKENVFYSRRDSVRSARRLCNGFVLFGYFSVSTFSILFGDGDVPMYRLEIWIAVTGHTFQDLFFIVITPFYCPVIAARGGPQFGLREMRKLHTFTLISII